MTYSIWIIATYRTVQFQKLNGCLTPKIRIILLINLAKEDITIDKMEPFRTGIAEGIEAHKAGKTQEADRCYTAILKSTAQAS